MCLLEEQVLDYTLFLGGKDQNPNQKPDVWLKVTSLEQNLSNQWNTGVKVPQCYCPYEPWS